MTKLIKILGIVILIYVLAFPCYALTERYVNTDSPAGGDGTTNGVSGTTRAYNNLAEWEADEDAVLTEPHIVYCSAPSGTDDTAALNIAGWATTAANYIHIKGNQTTGIWDDSKYVHNVGDTNSQMLIGEDFVVIEDFQSVGTATGGNANYRMFVLSQVASNSITIKDSILRGRGSTSNSHCGIQINNAQANVSIYNVIIYDMIGSDGRAVNVQAATGVTILNTTMKPHATYGINNGIGSGLTVMNCAIFDTSFRDLYDPTPANSSVSSYNAADDVLGSNGVALNNNAGGEWDASFTDISSSGVSDFSVKDTDSLVYDAGTDDPGNGLYSDDITGFTRTTNWDIGAFEYDDSAPPAPSGAKPPTQAIINITWACDEIYSWGMINGEG